MTLTIVFFIVGLVLLIIGAELLVRGAVWLAALMGISPVVIGLTVVAFGTSAPEMAVSAISAWTGNADIALGNVVGSNIFNILCILGLSAMVTPLIVNRQLVRVDVPLMLGISIAIYLLMLRGVLYRWECTLMFLGLCAYSYLQLKLGRAEPDPELEELAQQRVRPTAWRILLNVAFLLVGLGLLVAGSRMMVDSAVEVATYLGVSQTVIGLTIIAGGTSLPEVVTSLVAAIRGQRDIAVGNVVGSNVFNLLGVMGLAGMVSPQELVVPPSMINFDFPLMLAATAMCLPIFFTGGKIKRWEGALLFAYFIAYNTFLILRATEHDLLPRFNMVMIYFAAPLTLLALGTSVWYAINSKSQPSQTE